MFIVAEYCCIHVLLKFLSFDIEGSVDDFIISNCYVCYFEGWRCKNYGLIKVKRVGVCILWAVVSYQNVME